MSLRAAVYVRQSVHHVEGIDRGLARCREEVAKRGYTLAAQYADNNVSASKSRTSSQWADMLRDAEAGKFDVVVGVDMDRLARSIQDLAALIALDLRVLTVDGEIDLTSADGEFRATMLAAIARFEVRRKAERQTRANEFRTSVTGLPVPGRRRYGFESGNVVERTAEADHVRDMYRRVLAGDSIFRIAKDAGRPPVRIREVLTNPSYAGYVVRRGERFEAHESVARIVDREDFENVQAVLADPSRKLSPGSTIAYLASGIARCGVCDARLVKQGANYLCKDNLSHPCIKRELLDGEIQLKVFVELIVGQTPDDPAETSPLYRELDTARKKRAALQEQATWEGADVAFIRTEVAKIGATIARLEGELEAARFDHVAGDLIRQIEARIQAFTGDAEDLMTWWDNEWENLGLDAQRELAGRLSIHVDPGRGVGRVRIKKR